MRLLSVVGARPQFVKLAAIARAIPADVDHRIVHTGQHYDHGLSKVFFDELCIPAPDLNLGIGSGRHGTQTGRMLEALELAMESLRPACVLVYGDTNSTLAASLAAAKLHLPLAHLEAGLRSHNRSMPEEINRIVADHTADLCLAPTLSALNRLGYEGLRGRSVLIGDVMTDIFMMVRDQLLAERPKPPKVRRPYIVCTLHRAETTEDTVLLRRVIHALATLPCPVRLPVHPRLREACAKAEIDLRKGSISVVAPLSYKEMISQVLGAQAVVTDSGGLQKEAYLMRVPCVTIRAETEWTETVDAGWNTLDPRAEKLLDLISATPPDEHDSQMFGDGEAAVRAVSECTGLVDDADDGTSR